jgi:hypothetical protein
VPPPARVEVQAARRIAELGTDVRSGSLHASGLVAGGTEAGSVLLVDRTGRRVLGDPRVHGGPVTGLQLSADGKNLLSAGGELCIWWGTTSGAVEAKVKGPQRITAALLREAAGSPAGSRARAGGDERSEEGRGSEAVGVRAVAFFGTALGAMVRWPVGDKAAQPMRELACPAYPVQAARRTLPDAERCPFGAFVEAPDGSGAACVYPVTAVALSGQTLWRACREGSLYGEELDAKVRHGFGMGAVQAIAVRADGLVALAREDGELRLLDPRRREVVGQLLPPGKSQVMAVAGDLLAVAVGAEVRLYAGASRQPSTRFQAPGRVVALHLSSSEIRLLTVEGHADARVIRR